MDGWTKVLAATLVAVAGLIGFNLAIWRRLRQASRERRGQAGQGRLEQGQAEQGRGE